MSFPENMPWDPGKLSSNKPMTFLVSNSRVRIGDARHDKTDLKVFVVVIPKEGLAGPSLPILVWV